MKVFLSISWIIISCNSNRVSRDEMRQMINSPDATTVIKGFWLIGEARDSSFVNDIFSDVNDSRISHHMRFYGMSVYQEKMAAIKKITKIYPPRQITSDPDSAIVSFYNEIAKKRGWIK